MVSPRGGSNVKLSGSLWGISPLFLADTKVKCKLKHENGLYLIFGTLSLHQQEIFSKLKLFLARPILPVIKSRMKPCIYKLENVVALSM